MRKMISPILVLALTAGLATGVANADIESGLVGYWKFNEGGGSIVYDDSGNGLDGMLVGDARRVDSLEGLRGALDFDGNDYVRIPGSEGVHITGAITVAAWVNIRRVYTDWMSIATKADTGWRLSTLMSERRFHFALTGGPPWHYVNGEIVVPAGEWYHVCATFDGSYIHLYINRGEDPASPASYEGTISTNDFPIFIAANAERPGRQWNGLLDEVRIYDRALTNREVAELFEFREVVNRPPVADAGPDQTVECLGPGGTPVTLDGSGSHDPDGDPLTYTWTGPFSEGAGTVQGINPTVTLALGASTITLVVNDGQANSQPDSVKITVRDTTPPTITCPADVTLECPADTSVGANGSATGSDACSTVTITHSDALESACGNTGTLVRTWRATDEFGNSSSCIQTITIVDTSQPLVDAGPDITIEQATWQGTAVTLNGSAVDDCDPQLDCRWSEDGVILGESAIVTHTFSLGSHTLVFEAIDDCGNVGSDTMIVAVLRPVNMPDLTITDVWNENSTVCYQIMNIGDVVATAGHHTALYVDGVRRASNLVNEDLGPGERLRKCFGYAWECTHSYDNVQVRADHDNMVLESNEGNNNRAEIWKCDIIPPEIISGPIVQEVTQASAVIVWQTNENSDSVVKYGRSAGQVGLGEEITDTTPKLVHGITLPDLEPSATYHFVVQSTDPSGNTVESSDITFETLPLPDYENPTVSIIDPGVCQGIVDLSADATDNLCMDRVEFYIDGQRVFTDYSPSSPDWHFLWETTEYANGPYTLKTKAYDCSGKYGESELPVAVQNPIDADDPIVNIQHPLEDSHIAGEYPIIGYVQDDTDVAKIEYLVDGEKISCVDYPTKQQTVSFKYWWDTHSVPDGKHRFAVRATDIKDNEGLGTVDVFVENGEPPHRPYLAIKRHEVFVQGSVLAVELEVKNEGKKTAEDIKIRDSLVSLQPLSRYFNSVDYEAQFEIVDIPPPKAMKKKMRWDCVISDDSSLNPGNKRTYVYCAVPILIHPYPPKSMIGQPVKLSYKGPTGSPYEHEVDYAVSHQKLKDACDKAIEHADYVIVTNPYDLLELAFYPSFLPVQGPLSHSDVNKLLSDMAELAWDRWGVLGYFAHDLDPFGPVFTASELLDQVKPSGDWAKKLHPNFRQHLGGYLLIVGESEIVPCWDQGGFNIKWADSTVTKLVNLTDQPYADFKQGGRIPHLIVGRIVGERVTDLSVAIQNSIDGKFDRSNALLVSGVDPKDAQTQKGFVDNIKEVGQVLDNKNFKTPDVLHWSDKKYSNDSQRLKDFKDMAKKGQDVICFNGHGLAGEWQPALSTTDFPLYLGNTNPFVYADSCLTGWYSGIANSFLDSGAAVYIGATMLSPGTTAPKYLKYFFNKYWDASKSIAWVLTRTEEAAIKSHAWHSVPGYWAYIYNLYGDPKFGASVYAPASEAEEVASLADTSPPSSLQFEVPDYVVDIDFFGDGLDSVEIPGGDLLMEPGQLLIPFYSASVDYPQGYNVQDVVLAERSGLVTDTGLDIPMTPLKLTPSGGHAVPYSGPVEGWFPEQDYRWNVVDNPDGTATLVIVMYPFYYNPLTTGIRFYKNYSFDITYTISDVAITSLTTDKDAYEQGETVIVDVGLSNSGEAEDVVVSALMKSCDAVDIEDGLLLRTLHNLAGDASFSAQWDSSGFEAGYWNVEVTLEDTAGYVLDKKMELFKLGICSGEITELTATPESAQIGDDVSIKMTFNNTGTVTITGIARIRILDAAGDLIDKLEYTIRELRPSESASFSDIWNIPGTGPYDIVGDVFYDSRTAGPAIVEINTYGGCHIYDLERNDIIGPGDFSLFACCWLKPASTSGCGGTVPCAMCDFDCDGTVAPGDLAWFATAWSKDCSDPSIQYPPCRGGERAFGSLSTPVSAYSAPDVRVCSVILASPSASDTTETLPTSLSSLTQGQDYYVEVWASDVGSSNTGLTSVYADLDFHPCDSASILSAAHGGIFTMFESGVIGTCGIEELGGSSLAGAGTEPQWARVAIVKIHATTSGPVSCSLRPSATGIAAFGRGLIPGSQIELGPCDPRGCLPRSYSTYNDWAALGSPDCWCRPYQCDGDADGATQGIQRYRIMSNDLDIVAANWKKKIDDPTLDPCADIDHKPQGFQDYRVMSTDLAILIANWKKIDSDLAGDCPRPE